MTPYRKPMAYHGKGKTRVRVRYSFSVAYLSERTYLAHVKYQRSGRAKDIYQAVEFGRAAIRKVSSPPSSWLVNLAGDLVSRYREMLRASDLYTAVLAAQYGVTQAKGLSDRVWALHTLGNVLLFCFRRKGRQSDLRRSIQAFQDAVAAVTMETQVHMLPALNGLAGAWNHVYDKTTAPKALKVALLAAQTAVACPAPKTSMLWAGLSTLATLCDRQFADTGNISDLIMAISATYRAMVCLPGRHPAMVELLNKVGVMLNMYYEHTKRPMDLERAIHAGKLAASLAPANSERRSAYWGNLSNSLISRHNLTGDLGDLKEAVRLAERAIAITPANHRTMPEFAENLANKLEALYRWTGDRDHLDRATALAQQAVSSTPTAGRQFVSTLDNLSSKLFLQHERTGALIFIAEAIKMSLLAVLKTPLHHQDQSIYLSNLANCCETLYNETDEAVFLKNAVMFAVAAILHLPRSHIHYPASFGSLGSKLEQCYGRTGHTGFLRRAIWLTNIAVKTSPNGSLEKAARLSDLGNQYELQYERTAVMAHLEEAIAKAREAIHITPQTHAEQPGRLNNLVVKLHSYYARTGQIRTLEEAIGLAECSVRLTPRQHRDKAMYSNTLGTLLHSRYEETKQQGDLYRAIQLERYAVNTTQRDNPGRMSYQHNLGLSLESLYAENMDDIHLAEAIDLVTQAVNSAPLKSPIRAQRLNSLLLLRESRYLKNGESSDRDEMLRIALEAWNCTAAVPFERIKAGSRALKLLAENLRSLEQFIRGSPIYTELETATTLGYSILDLVPLVHTRLLGRQDQPHVVSTFAGVASNLACLLLKNDRIGEAVQCLERGRTIIIGQMLNDRQDTAQLQHSHPAWAKQYKRLVHELNTFPKSKRFESSAIRLSVRRRKAAAELEACLASIRALPGYGAFLSAQSVATLQDNAADGYIGIVNVTDFGSDAIIVSKKEITRINLPNMSASETTNRFNHRWIAPGIQKQKRKNFKLLQALEWLWKNCVSLIIQHISPIPSTTIEELPRVWWIGTGAAYSIPFHSAGNHDKGSTDNTMSRVISSYTPSIHALAYSRQQATQTHVSDDTLLLLATMQTTPAGNKVYPELQVTEEKDKVLLSAADRIKIRILEQPNVRQVSKWLANCSVVHFACHAEADRHDPSTSALVLQRVQHSGVYKPDLLSVYRISQLKLEHAQIAYLSACSTAESKAARLADEVIHIASGFQVAGFPHVIGSLWRAGDTQCAKLAGYFYEQLFGYGQGVMSTDASLALHKAVQKLRQSHRDCPSLWAQFIHYGV